jgi:DNA-binding transcriptional LysR family regulator
MTSNQFEERKRALGEVSTVIEVVESAINGGRGGRAYVAKSRGISRSIVTDALRRTEKFLGCKLFGTDDPLSLTPYGKALTKVGTAFVGTLTAFRALVGEHPKGI